MRTLSAATATMLALLTVHTNVAAQMGGDPEVHRTAMEKLDFLVGEWEGDGWLLQREGRQEIRQSEVVRYELGGTIVNAFAVGTITRPDGASMAIIDFRLARTGG